jgi:hypothetical protein
MPERWRNRLKRQFWRPRAFRDLLNQLAGGKPRTRSAISKLLDDMQTSALDPVTYVEKHLEALDLQMVAGRSVEQVATRLAEKLHDRSEPPLSEQQVGLINDYLAIRGEPGKALEELRAGGQDRQDVCRCGGPVSCPAGADAGCRDRNGRDRVRCRVRAQPRVLHRLRVPDRPGAGRRCAGKHRWWRAL